MTDAPGAPGPSGVRGGPVDVGRVTDAFVGLTGRSPDGIWSAPGRVNLIGEHTDYNDGFVLPLAIDLRAVVAVELREDGVARCMSLQQPGVVERLLDAVAPGSVSGWAAYVLGVAWALRQLEVDVPGFDLVVDSAVPVGAGLSSSAALETAVALALTDLAGARLDRTRLALACRRAENDMVGAPTGVMDQMAALHGHAGHAVLLDCRTLDVRDVPLELDRAGLTLLVVDTGVRHANAEAGFAARRTECEQAAAQLGVASLRDATLDDVEARLSGVLLRRARHVVTENARVLAAALALEESGPAAVGDLLDASQASMRDDFEISCPEVDVAVAAATSAGALAARLTGGGFGGCVIALCTDPQTVSRAVTDAYAAHGFAAPYVFTVRSADGAARVGEDRL